jgi:hypothetical protein
MTGAGETWDEQAILRAFELWLWCPNGSEVIDAPEYRLAFWPPGFGGAAHVERIETERTADELTDEINGLVRSRGVTDVLWNVSPHTRPAGLAARLLELGATVRSESGLLSRSVPGNGHLDVGPTPGVTIHRVTDIERLTDFRRISATVFAQPLPDDDAIAAEAVSLDPDSDGCRFVAYVDGTPAGTGAIGIGDHGGAYLYGAATLPALRHRGAHRAVLAARARWAYDHGAPIMLVKGRLSTSAPTLLRAGFTLHGHQRELSLQLA